MPSLFEPEWLPLGRSARWGIGLSIGCPVHIGCRVEIYFANPLDGFGPVPGQRLYHRIGSGLGGLTLSPEVDAGEHGRFQIVRGRVVFRLQ